MANFIVRFDLGNATTGNYTSLKNILIRSGFSKTIKDKNGISYILPQGEYLAISTTKTKEQILNISVELANKIIRSPKILVTESAVKGCAWSGLRLA